MIFNNPTAFFMLALIPMYGALRKLRVFSTPSLPLAIFDYGAEEESDVPSNFRFLTFLARFSDALALAAFVLMVVAFADPVRRNQEKVFTSKGTEILFVLDTSPSMAAKDISVLSGLRSEQISRFEAAKRGIKTLVESDRGASFGLVAMAKEAALLVPPTRDIDFFERQLDGVSIGAFGDGTAIGIGLSSAVFHLSSSDAPKKAIVLITDGENNAGSVHPETAAELSRQNAIAIYAIGIGTRGTVQVEYVNPENGKIVSGFYESEFDPAGIEKIALSAGGRYFGVESLSLVLDSMDMISKKESVVQTFHIRTTDVLCFRRFLWLSLALFASSWLLKRVFLREVL